MSFGAEDISFVLVDPKIEGYSVLYDRQVEAGEQYMVVVTEFGYGDDEDTMVFACVTAYDAGAAVGTFAVSTYVLSLCRLIKVGHESAVELEVTHTKYSLVSVRLCVVRLGRSLHYEAKYNSPAKLRIRLFFANRSGALGYDVG